MDSQKLTQAQISLIQAAISLESSIENKDNIDDAEIQIIDGFKRNIQDIVGQLAVKIAKLEQE